MPAPTTPRLLRARGVPALLALILAIAIGITGCAGDDHPEPTLPTVNFTAKLIVTIADHHLTTSKGPRDDQGVVASGPEATVPAGTVIEIVNSDTGVHRLQGDTVFDTGILRPGEHTTVVLTNDATNDRRITITDPSDAAVSGAITVRPKPTG